MWRGRRDGRRWRNIRCVGKCALLTYFPLSSLYLSLPSRVSRISIQTTVLHLLSFLPRAVPRIPESQSCEKREGRKKKVEREKKRERAFQRVFRMKSRPNEVRKLPNGEASSLLLVGSKWRGKKCRLAVAFVATGEWRTRGELRAVNRVAPSLLLTSELDGSGWFLELGIVFRLTSSFLNFNSRRVSLIIIIIRRGKTVGNIILLEAIIWEKIPQKSMRIGLK